MKDRSTTHATAQFLPLLRETLADVQTQALTDGELLTRYVATRDEAAFALLVRRLGTMVFGICKRVLGSPHDAEDAFQTVFMVLARKAASIRPPSQVATWLYGVAQMTARKLKQNRGRRLARETAGTVTDEPLAPIPTREPDLAPVLDEELARLPERLRWPIVLCELRELTIAEAAEALLLPAGTVASRLSRGRNLLATRLSRRGVLLVAASNMLACAASAAPRPLLRTTVSLAGDATASTSASVHALSNEVLQMMMWTKLRQVCVGLCAPAILFLGGIGMMQPSVAAPVPKGTSVPVTNVLSRFNVENPTGLLSAESVQKDIGFTDEQKKKYDEARETFGQTVKNAFQQLVQQAQQAAGAAGAAPPMLPDISKTIAQAHAAFDKAALALLKPEQLQRLKQITIQAQGPRVFLDHRVVRELGLTIEQEDKIQAQLPKPATEALDIFGGLAVGGPNPLQNALDSQAEKMSQTHAEVIKLLTKEQRAKWDQLTGKEIPLKDLLKANNASDILGNLGEGLLPGLEPQ